MSSVQYREKLLAILGAADLATFSDEPLTYTSTRQATARPPKFCLKSPATSPLAFRPKPASRRAPASWEREAAKKLSREQFAQMRAKAAPQTSERTPGADTDATIEDEYLSGTVA